MRTAFWERWAPLSGIIFVGLIIPTFFLPAKSPPGADDAAETWASFVQDHRSALLVSMCFSGTAVAAFLVFLGHLATRLRTVDQDWFAFVALGAGLVTAGIWYVWISFQGVLAWTSAEGLDPAVVKTLLAAADFAFPFPVATLVAATSFAAWRSAMWPPWLSYVGLVGALWIWIGGLALAGDGFFAPTSGARLTGWAFFFLWVLAVSSFLLRTPQERATAGSA